MKHRWQIGNPPHGFDSRNPLGILPGEAGPFPGGQVGAWLSEKEDLPVARLDSIGGKQQDSLNLFNAGQPEEISRRHQPKDTVSIGREDIGGMNQGEAFGRKLSRQAAAVGTKQVGLDGRVSHQFFSGEGGQLRPLPALPTPGILQAAKFLGRSQGLLLSFSLNLLGPAFIETKPGTATVPRKGDNSAGNQNWHDNHNQQGNPP